MNANQVVSEIKSLDLGIVDSKAALVETAIQETAQAIAASGLYLVKGGTSPSSKRSYQRLYLQTKQGVNHDSRTQDYRENVIDFWEWETCSGGYRKQISAGSLVKTLAEIRALANNR